MNENRENQQYFFTDECIAQLTSILNQNDACLCVPSVALKIGAMLFDIDTRFSDYGRFVFYDLLRGLHSQHRKNTTALQQFEYRFSAIVCDPPFSFVKPKDIARNINALLTWRDGATAYVCYPCSGFDALELAFLELGFIGQESGIELNYNHPPRGMGNGEKREIRLYQFERVL